MEGYIQGPDIYQFNYPSQWYPPILPNTNHNKYNFSFHLPVPVPNLQDMGDSSQFCTMCRCDIDFFIFLFAKYKKFSIM